MIHGALLVLTFIATLGCGLAAGVFFAFDSFVMPGLRRLPAPKGIAAMQSINITAVTPVFMLDFLGTALLCAALVVIGVINLGQPYGPWLLAGGLAYLAGPIGMTARFNVPRNNTLARLDPETPASAEYWARYVREWSAGNAVRTLFATAATGLLIAGMLSG